MTAQQATRTGKSIWWFAFGYFACYAPYSALTKALSQGHIDGSMDPPSGFELLPLTVAVSAVGMVVFLTLARWWRHATHSEFMGLSLPRPTRWTALSGLCTAGIIGTTTLAYTFEGVSIVFVMLLMRGGVLLIAPVVDIITGRSVRWFSAAGSLFSLGALVVAFSERGGYQITLLCALDIALYLTCYFIRFQFMSRLAKSDDPDVNKRYFVEEQMTAAPALLVILAIIAAVGEGSMAQQLRSGFVEFSSGLIVLHAVVIGLLSQGTGIFGSLVFLDKRENTFCVPVNRSSSILAGVVASYGLVWLVDQPLPSAYQLVGAGLIITAIAFLSIPPLLEKRRASSAG